jgi:CBS domain-containing protein
LKTVADAIEPPVVVEPATTVQEASAAMLDARHHAALVVEGGRVRGLITVDDISRALADGLDAGRTEVAAIADSDPPVARPEEPLAELHQRMRAAGRGVAAVVGPRGEPVGVLADHEAAV